MSAQQLPQDADPFGPALLPGALHVGSTLQQRIDLIVRHPGVDHDLHGVVDDAGAPLRRRHRVTAGTLHDGRAAGAVQAQRDGRARRIGHHHIALT